jgi:hypothetical protein
MGDTVTLSVSLNTTSDGFMSQECPACERIFKVAPGKGSPEPVTHCPYCNHEGENCWLTKDQAAYMGAYGAEQLIAPQLDQMVRDINRGSRSNDFLKVSASVKKPPRAVAPSEEDDMQSSITFSCCSETIRHDGKETKLYCPICGGSQNV